MLHLLPLPYPNIKNISKPSPSPETTMRQGLSTSMSADASSSRVDFDGNISVDTEAFSATDIASLYAIIVNLLDVAKDVIVMYTHSTSTHTHQVTDFLFISSPYLHTQRLVILHSNPNIF
ncbi:hypothetical protein L6452_19435 [Arctium lappa]|uniref:Uncharacterized protein n=1 Tax=Arctium lappa TaxID=4217 RepID=A0ACB9B8Y4_ARCLA|nr:hypothetical protein L6452_19435 [Arctium lappa]